MVIFIDFRMLLVVLVALAGAAVGSDYGEPGKRAAYSYVSEYKRLPVYNFGLGKRADGDKRIPGQMYSFGLGKRDYDSQEDYEEADLKEEYGKRVKQYDFGLGKRAGPYSFGLGKRLSPYSPQPLQQSALDKRIPGQNLYSFGLGKREIVEPKRVHRYSFGLGKR